MDARLVDVGGCQMLSFPGGEEGLDFGEWHEFLADSTVVDYKAMVENVQETLLLTPICRCRQ
jgi:hypothetical protein